MKGYQPLLLHTPVFSLILRNNCLIKSLFLFMLLAGFEARAAGPSVTQLDIRVTKFKVTEMAKSDKPGMTVPGLTRVKAGEEVYLQCAWAASAGYADFYVDNPIDFTNSLIIDGKVAHTFEGKVFPNHYGKEFAGFPNGSSSFYKWKPAVPGKHTVGCRLDPMNMLKEKPEWKQDSESTIEVVVWRNAEPAEVKAPVMLNPPSGARYELGDNLKVPIRFRINEALFSLAKEKTIPEILFQITLKPLKPSGSRELQDDASFYLLTPGGLFNSGYRTADTNPEEWSIEYEDLEKFKLGTGDYELYVHLVVGEIHSPASRRTITIHGPLSTKGSTASSAKGSVLSPNPKVTAPPPKIRSGTSSAPVSSAEAGSSATILPGRAGNRPVPSEVMSRTPPESGRIVDAAPQTGTDAAGTRTQSGAEINQQAGARDSAPGAYLKRGSAVQQERVAPQQPQAGGLSQATASEPSKPLQTADTSRVAALPQMLDFEAEDLLKENKATASGGNMGLQSMDQFGARWSNGAQLFWGGGTRGAVLDLILDIPVAATYAVELYMTRAPDYGILRIEVDGKASSVEFQGYSPRVVGANPLQVGKFSLQAGQRKISLMITGKYQDSSGHAAGIDRIRLYPAGAR